MAICYRKDYVPKGTFVLDRELTSLAKHPQNIRQSEGRPIHN